MPFQSDMTLAASMSASTGLKLSYFFLLWLSQRRPAVVAMAALINVQTMAVGHREGSSSLCLRAKHSLL